MPYKLKVWARACLFIIRTELIRAESRAACQRLSSFTALLVILHSIEQGVKSTKWWPCVVCLGGRWSPQCRVLWRRGCYGQKLLSQSRRSPLQMGLSFSFNPRSPVYEDFPSLKEFANRKPVDDAPQGMDPEDFGRSFVVVLPALDR